MVSQTTPKTSDVFLMNLLLGGAQRGQLISAALDIGCDGSDAEAGVL